MLFSTFLTENKNLKNEATLVLHKIINMVDTAHVDVSETDIRFTVGTMIKKGAYDNLKVVIRKKDSEAVRLGQSNDGSVMALVIDTPKLPDRKGIDAFLSHTSVFNSFVDTFVKYLSDHHVETEDGNKHEPEKESENNENFEINYVKLTEALKRKVEEYKNATGEVDSQMQGNANLIKAETHKLSLNKLKGEYLGNSEGEFLVIVKKMPEWDQFFEHLDKELADKLQSRLISYYKTEIAPLTK